MPTTVSGLTFFENQFETGLYQGITQVVDGFNGASGGAMTLTAGARKGRRPENTFFQVTDGVIQRRDPTSTGSKTPTTFADESHKSIKLFNTAPMTWRRQDWVDTGLSTETGTRLFGIQYGQSLARNYLNTAISALVGSINSIGATAIHDVGGSSTFAYDVLNTGLGKLGDRRQNARTIVAYSKPLTDLSNTAFTSQQVAFQVGGTVIFNGGLPSLGLPVLNTDAAPLYEPDTATNDKYNTLVLVPGALMLRTGPSSTVFTLIPGTASAVPENQTWLLSIESEFELTVKGVSYTGASDNPTDSQLADSANWTHVTGTAVDVKNGPGILIRTQ